MRTITTHHINPCNRAITIEAGDEPGPGGASHVYDVRLPGWTRAPSTGPGELPHAHAAWLLNFQMGVVQPNGEGANGLTHEALLAIIIDRLQGFQAGPWACPENTAVLAHLQGALAILAARTKRRDEHGIEGTHAADPAPALETRSGGQIAYEAWCRGVNHPPRWDLVTEKPVWEATASAVVVAAVKLGQTQRTIAYWPTLVETAARAAHEANRAWCLQFMDQSQVGWDDAPEWQRASAIKGVEAIAVNPATTPKQSHDGWMAQKVADGWTYGPEKDPEAKRHPCLVPYAMLPAAQQAKDHIFGAVVRAVLSAAAQRGG